MLGCSGLIIKVGFPVCLVVAPAFFGIAEASERRQADAVIEKSARMQSSPGASDAGPGTVIGEGSVVRIVEAGGAWTRIENDVAGGWVSSNSVVPISKFGRLKKWKYPGRAEVGDGDYSALYSFKSDGSFVVEEAVLGEDESYRFVQRRGQLYAYRGIVWARIGHQPPDTNRMFLVKGQTVCWQPLLDGRCP